MAQGAVRLWIEIFSESVQPKAIKEWDTTPKPSEDLEVRVIVWDSIDLKAMDDEDTNDGFVKAFFDSDKAKETDTHWRNSDGKCSWNWRLIYRLSSTNPEKAVTIQTYDRDVFKANDLIGEGRIDLTTIL